MSMVNPKLTQSLREISNRIGLYGKRDKRIEASSVSFLSNVIGLVL